MCALVSLVLAPKGVWLSPRTSGLCGPSDALRRGRWLDCLTRALELSRISAPVPAGRLAEHQRHPLHWFGQALQVRAWLGRPKFAGVAPSANAQIPQRIMVLPGQGGERLCTPRDRTFCTEVTPSQASGGRALHIQGGSAKHPWILMVQRCVSFVCYRTTALRVRTSRTFPIPTRVCGTNHGTTMS